MLRVRRSDERGRTRISWLDSFHSFSFGEYYDPEHTGFRRLRVINEDFIAGGGGFGTHGHRDMEILTYVVRGKLAHKDSLGNGSVIAPGRLQRMTAGSGIAHSEFNASPTDEVHLLQIWIEPERRGLPPGYEEKEISAATAVPAPAPIAARDGRGGALTVHQDAIVYAGLPKKGATHGLPIAAGRGVWIQLVRGAVRVEAGPGESADLRAGDAAIVEEAAAWRVVAAEDAEYLAFDLA